MSRLLICFASKHDHPSMNIISITNNRMTYPMTGSPISVPCRNRPFSAEPSPDSDDGSPSAPGPAISIC